MIRSRICFCFEILCLVCVARSGWADVSSSWSADADGVWSLGANWSGGNAATGTTGVATFSTAITASRTITLDASPWSINGLSFANTGSYGWTITGGILNLAGTAPAIAVAVGSSAKVASALSGSSGLRKNGGGSLTLSGANTFSGGTLVSSGTLQIGDGTGASATAGGGVLAVGSGASLLFNVNAAVTLGNTSVTSASATIQNVGAGQVTLTNGTISGTVNGGVAGLVLAVPITADFSPQGDVTLTSASSSRTLPSGAANTTVHIVGSGLFWWIGSTLSANAPTIDVAAGVTASLHSSQTAGALYYRNLTGAGSFTFDGGNASQIGYVLGTNTMGGTLTANRPVSFGNGGQGGMAGSSALSAGSAGMVIFNSTIDNTYSGSMSGFGALIKTNANTLTLTGVNTYSGPTIVGGGTLVISGTGLLGGGAYSGAIINNGSFVFGNSAAQTLSGTLSGTGSVAAAGASPLLLKGYNTYGGPTRVSSGVLVGGTGGACVNSAVTVNDGATNGVRVIAYGDTWTCASLAYTGAFAGLDFDFASYPVSLATAPLEISGDLCVTGIVSVTVRNGVWPVTGIYPLVSYAGKLNGTGTFSLGQLPSGMSATLVNNTEAKRIELSVTAVPASAATVSAWVRLDNGDASGVWGASDNWSAGVPDGTDTVADFSLLNLTASAYITNDSPRTVGGLRFGDTTASHDWFVTNASLTLASSQTVPVIVVSNRTATLFSGLAGSQGFFKDGAGTLTLAGGLNNLFGGTVVAASGTLYVVNGATLKNTTSPFLVVPGASLCVYARWDGNAVTNALTLGGRGIGTWGALHVGQNVTMSGPITLTSDCRMTHRDNCNMNGTISVVGTGKNLELDLSEYKYATYFNGKINLGTGSLTLNSIADGRNPQGFTVALAAANTYSGGTVLTNYAILQVRNAGALGSGGLTLYPNTGVDLYGNSLALPSLSSPGGAFITDSGATAGTSVLAISPSADTGFSGVISNGAVRVIALIKTGSGALTLTGTNTYAGATLVSNGTFGISGTLGTGTVTVCDGCVFGAGATGVVARAALGGTLALMDNSKLWVDVQGAAADTISVTGSVSIGNGAELQVSGDQTHGGNWKVLESVTGTVSGTFTLAGALHGTRVSYTANAVWLNVPFRGTLLQLQ